MNYKHGEAALNTPRYRAWVSMHERCHNPRHKKWKHYGGRGVRVCERWAEYENFAEDMGPHPGKGWSLDRWPDKNGDYEPTNCRWATSKMQNDNRRPIKLTPDQVLEIRCSEGTQRALGLRFGVSHTTIYDIQHGRRWVA